MAEQQLQLQTDTVSNLPGGGLRMITGTVMINGVPTVVQMQVIALAGPNGELLDVSAQTPATADSDDILRELREIRRLLARQYGEPVFEPGLSPY